MITSRSKITILGAAFVLSTFISIAQKTDFSGTWLINEQKSDFGGQSEAAMFKQLKILQTQDSLVVQGIKFGDINSSMSTTSYPINGNSISIVFSNKRKMTAYLKWGNDGKTLSRNSSYSLPDDPDKEDYSSREIWSLSNDKKTLTLERTFINETGNLLITAVYERQ